MYLLLAHFDPLLGPIVFTSVPSPLPSEVAELASKLLDLPLKKTPFEFLKSEPTLYQFINFPFDIPSLEARGHVESLMLSAVFDQMTDLNLAVPVIREIANSFQTIPNIEKGFHRTVKSSAGGKEYHQIEKLVRDGFTTLQHKLEQFQIAERVFSQNALSGDTSAVKVAQIFNKVFITTIDARVPQGAAVLYEAGTIVGNNLVPTFVGDNLEKLLAEMAVFWRKYAMGQIDEVQIKPRQLFFNVYECFECSHYPNVGRPVCKFDEGVLTSLFSKKLQKDVKVTETDCYATGKGRCSFIVDIKPSV